MSSLDVILSRVSQANAKDCRRTGDLIRARWISAEVLLAQEIFNRISDSRLRLDSYHFDELLVAATATLHAFQEDVVASMRYQWHSMKEYEGQMRAADIWQALTGEYLRPEVLPSKGIWGDSWQESAERIRRRGLAGLLTKRDELREMRMSDDVNVRAETIINGLLSGLRDAHTQARVLAQDHLMASIRQGMETQYEATGEVGGIPYMRIAIWTRGTCMACILLDGTLYEKLSDIRDHPQGRCIGIPHRGPIQQRPSGKERFLRMSEADQMRYMGAEYYAAWKADQFDLDDLVMWTTAGYAVTRTLGSLVDDQEN